MSDYPFATILRPGRNRSRRPIHWGRWLGLAALLLALSILSLT